MEETEEGIKSQESVLKAQQHSLENEASSCIPLLQLVQQLLRNAPTQAIQNLQDLVKDANRVDLMTEVHIQASAFIELLLQYQRLLVAKLDSLDASTDASVRAEPDAELQ